MWLFRDLPFIVCGRPIEKCTADDAPRMYSSSTPCPKQQLNVKSVVRPWLLPYFRRDARTLLMSRARSAGRDKAMHKFENLLTIGKDDD